MIRTLTRVLAVSAVILPLAVSAQQDPYYTHFTYNKVLLNPAYAGASGSFCINAITHQQWRSFEDETHLYKTQSQGTSKYIDDLPTNIAPKTSGFAFYAPFNVKNKTTDEVKNYGGAYVGFVSDVIAYETNTYMRGGVAGAYTLADGSDIRIGVDFVSLTKQLDGNKLRPQDPNDPKIPAGKPGDTKTTFGAGLFYHNPNFHEMYVGLSSSNIKPQTFSYGTSGAINVKSARHIYLMAGGHWDNFLANPSLAFDPAILIKAVNDKGGLVKPQVDLQGMVTWNQLYAGGANFRFNAFGVDALSLMLGYYPPIKGNDPGPNGKNLLRIGYSYDITLQSLRRASNGTHELQVNYCFRITLPERIEPVYRHPRYMQRPENIE